MQQHQRRCRRRRRWHYTAQQKIRWTVFLFGGVRCIIACCWWLTYEYVWVSGWYNLYTSFVGSSAVGCCTYVCTIWIFHLRNDKSKNRSMHSNVCIQQQRWQRAKGGTTMRRDDGDANWVCCCPSPVAVARSVRIACCIEWLHDSVIVIIIVIIVKVQCRATTSHVIAKRHTHTLAQALICGVVRGVCVSVTGVVCECGYNNTYLYWFGT